VVADIKTNIDL